MPKSKTEMGEMDVLHPVSDYPTISYSDEQPTCSRNVKYGDRKSVSVEDSSVIPSHVGRSRSSSSSSKVECRIPRPIDQHEKVSVRLVKDHGLVVEADEDDDAENQDSFSVRSASIIGQDVGARHATGSKRRNTVGTDFRLTSSPPATKSSMISSKRPSNNNNNSLPSPEVETKLERETHRHNSHPFGKSRHGSSNDKHSVGVSSLIPLMDGVKESHKIEVVIKPPPSMMKSYDGSSIHLCCALVFVFSATIFSSLTLLLAKVLKNRDHHPVSIAFWRYLGILLPSIPLTLFYIVRGKKQKILGSVWPIHDMDKAVNAMALLMRGVLGSTAIILRYCSLNYMTIANTSVISYCAPVFAAIFAPICLRKDRSGVIPVFIGILTCFGVLIISKPSFLGGTGWNEENLKGVFLSALSMLCSALLLICVRYLLERVHFSLMLLILGLWGSFEAGVLAVTLEVFKVPTLLPDIVMMLGIAVLSFFGQLFLLLAMRTGHIGSTSVMKSCDIMMTFLWQYLFLKTKADSFEILSALLIVLSVWFVCFRKWIGSLRSNNVIRHKLSFLLH